METTTNPEAKMTSMANGRMLTDPTIEQTFEDGMWRGEALVENLTEAQMMEELENTYALMRRAPSFQTYWEGLAHALATGIRQSRENRESFLQGFDLASEAR